MYSIRQNPNGYNIPQDNLFQFTLKEKYVQCPWSYMPKEHEGIKKGIIPNKFTKIFMEELKKGDKMVILYRGLKKALYAEIISDPLTEIDVTIYDEYIQTPKNYNPILRKIRIIKILDFTLKQQQTLCRIKKPDTIRRINE